MKKFKWAKHSDLGMRITPSVLRDEYLDYMTFKRNDRTLFTEFLGPMIGLKEEWEEQGATPEELDFSAFPFRSEWRAGLPIKTGRLIRSTEAVVEETEDYVITRDDLGRLMKLMKGAATIPLPMNYPVRTMDDWLKIKPLYQFSEERFGENWDTIGQSCLARGRTVCVYIPGGFDEPRQLLGEENLCLAYYEQPDLIHDILGTIGETARKVLDRVSAKVQVDVLAVHEDMAGKSGPLAGPRQIEEFIKPYYRGIWDMLTERGARLFEQDSDGDMNAVIPAFLDAGINSMHPLEPMANMDIVKIRALYGTRLAFFGGIDKHVIRHSKEEIVRELEYKIPPMVATGGCVLALDHRIPNGTPLENYRFYVRTAWEIINRERARK